MAQPAGGIKEALVRRHRAATKVVAGVFALSTLLLVVAAVRWLAAGGRTFKDLADETLGRVSPERAHDPVVLMTMWLVVAFIALGAIYFRRARFAPVRLQAIAGLRGAGGLLETLQKTTAQVALMGAAVAVIGFVSSLLTGLLGDMLRGWLISAVVLAYAYPRLGAWRRVVEAADEVGVEADPAAKGTLA